MPFTGVGHTMVLHQFAANLRQKIRPVQGLAIGHKVNRAKHHAFLISNATIEFTGVFEQLDADASGGKAFFGGVSDDASFGVHKGQF
jgi:hypothetical protein